MYSKPFLGLILSQLLPHSIATNPPSESSFSISATQNDFACRSANHPNPVILLHSLGSNHNKGLNELEAWLGSKGFCTFSLTYGAHSLFPTIGGLKSVAESSKQIAQFIKDVQSKTGASKVDLIGHSEGGFQTMYTTKFDGVAPIVKNIIAIGPSTHGTTLGGLWNLAYILGNASRELIDTLLHTVGCAACTELGVGGSAVAKLNDGKPIVQAGNIVTIVTSKTDEIATPPETAFVRENGVYNFWVQDYCPGSTVKHFPEAHDKDVWNIVLNSLESQIGRKFTCSS